MTFSSSSLQSLRRVFHDGFSAQDIAESIVSRDAEADARQVREFMEERALEVVGIRCDGLVAGYAERQDMISGPCGQVLRTFEPSQLVLHTSPLTEVVLGLRERPRLFVMVMGRVAGIVTRTDLQKPPVRMWLFGMVTLVEMRMNRMILQFASGDWRQHLTESRLHKANELLAERRRRHQQLELIDCLQFSDKCRIIARDESLRRRTRFDSKRQIDEVAKRLERLRNNLAHAQDIISADWETVVELSEGLDDLLDGPRDPS